jgi:hypothetical protein
MRPTPPEFDTNDPMHGHVDFLTSLYCWECNLLFERPDWGPTAETFYRYCADVSERAKAVGWRMIAGHPYCPACAARRPVA